MQQKYNKFQSLNLNGKNRGVIVCECCGKRTRETGAGESIFTKCVRCINLSYAQNARDDKQLTEEEYKDMVIRINNGERPYE